MFCPYTDRAVWCERRTETSVFACDSCPVLFPDMYGEMTVKIHYDDEERIVNVQMDSECGGD